jgi:hypothetical protein
MDMWCQFIRPSPGRLVPSIQETEPALNLLVGRPLSCNTRLHGQSPYRCCVRGQQEPARTSDGSRRRATRRPKVKRQRRQHPARFTQPSFCAADSLIPQCASPHAPSAASHTSQHEAIVTRYVEILGRIIYPVTGTLAVEMILLGVEIRLAGVCHTSHSGLMSMTRPNSRMAAPLTSLSTRPCSCCIFRRPRVITTRATISPSSNM